MKTYTPKAVRGIKFPGHIRINRTQLAKLFSTPGWTFSGFIVGNKVNPFHFFGGWHLACVIEHYSEKEMGETINSFLWYLESELGNDCAIYLKKTRTFRKVAIPQVCTFVPTLL